MTRLRPAHRSRLVIGAAVSLAVLGTLTVLTSLPWRTAARRADAAAASAPASAPGPSATAAERVALAEAEVRRTPEDITANQRMALAVMRLQRETGDPALYRKAEEALLQARKTDPEDYHTRRLLAWVLAGQHRFDEALALARECVRRSPDDFWNYGVIGDALTETGDYPGAVAAVQKMVDLKPGSLSYARAAHLRRLHGQTAGALRLYDMALEATSPRETESRAWLHTQVGEIRFLTGDLDGAETAFRRADGLVPGYHLARAGNARLLGARGRLAQAAAAWESALARVDRPDWRAALGDVYLAQGRRDRSESEYRTVEGYLAARMDDPTADATHQLAEFLADRGRKPAQAVALARREAAGASDIKAFDTLAWAEYHAGRYADAQRAAQKALRLGTKEPKLLYHAGMIARRLPGERRRAAELLREALALNPNWHVLDAPAARRALRDLVRS